MTFLYFYMMYCLLLLKQSNVIGTSSASSSSNERRQPPPPSSAAPIQNSNKGKELASDNVHSDQDILAATRLMQMTGGADGSSMVEDGGAYTQPLHGTSTTNTTTTNFDPKPASWVRSKTKAAYQHMLKHQKEQDKRQASGLSNVTLAGKSLLCSVWR